MIIELSAPGIRLTQAEIQGGITLTRAVNTGENITLGSCVAGKFEFSTLDLNAQSLKHYAGTEFLVSIYDLDPYVFIGGDLLIFKDGDRYYFPANRRSLGLFTAQKPERINETKWKFVCYDRMILFDKPVDTWFNSLPYPISLKEMLLSLCQYCGVRLETQTFTNSDFVVQKNIAAANITGREVLSWIAELAACFCTINADGKLVLDFYKKSSTVIAKTISNRVSDYDVQKIDKLQVKAKENDIGVIVGTGSNAYIIQGNPLMFTTSDARIRPAAEAIFAKISALAYTPMEVEIYDKDGLCVPGDIVQVQTRRGLYTMAVTGTVDNGIKSTATSVGAENRSKLQSVNRCIQQLRGKTNEIVADVEQFSVTLSNVEANTAAKFLATADQIAAEVTRASTAEGQLSSSLSVQADEIALKVAKTDYNGNTISSLINQTATTILLQANRINLNGYVTVTSLTNGQTTVDGGNIKTGIISANRLESSVLTTENIEAKNLTLTGKFYASSSRGSVKIQNGRVEVGYGNNGSNVGALYYDSGQSTLYVQSGVGYGYSGHIQIAANNTIEIKPGNGYAVYIGTGSYNDTVYIGTSSSNLSTLAAYRYSAQGRQGWTGTFKTGDSTPKTVTVTGGIITGVS